MNVVVVVRPAVGTLLTGPHFSLAAVCLLAGTLDTRCLATISAADPAPYLGVAPPDSLIFHFFTSL